MAKKKNITADNIYSMYMDYVLENGRPPENVYIFSKENNFDESLFYQFFGSFEAVEKSIFAAFFDNTISLLENNNDYAGFDNRNKLLSFYNSDLTGIDRKPLVPALINILSPG